MFLSYATNRRRKVYKNLMSPHAYKIASRTGKWPDWYAGSAEAVPDSSDIQDALTAIAVLVDTGVEYSIDKADAQRMDKQIVKELLDAK